MGLFKKKKPIVVEERTADTVPFEIPEIIREKKPYEQENFVSPIFGRKVKDEIVIPNPHERKGDQDLQFDTFRTKPKMTREKMIEKYGTAYPEFNVVRGSTLEEAMEEQKKRKEERVVKKETRSVYQQPIFDDPEDDEEEEDLFPSYDDVDDIEEETIEEPIVEPVTEPVKEKPVQPKRHYTTSNRKYKLPTIDLLKVPERTVNNDEEWLNQNIAALNSTFEHFGIPATVKQYTKGPTVTRYEIQVEPGVNLGKFNTIEKNIKACLAAETIRIQAPIPGKTTVGIEAANKVAEMVHFYDVVSTDQFKNSEDPLTVALGIDIDGYAVYTSVQKMPHGLVAGTTGSGKSVCINTILISLLFKYKPDELKLMLVDPKMVELLPYEDIPHLLTPVITDPKIAMAGLKWAVDEMDRRFKSFAKHRVRNIKKYNSYAKANPDLELEYMPYIMIVVDELADLMMVSSNAVEDAIMRLTQKARACGIHLIVATQRPSTDVIKGTIKSNLPTRIAFMVSSSIDSRTILDKTGAELLLGRGDMLLDESGKHPHRLQGAFISDEDIRAVNEYIRSQGPSEYWFDEDSLVKRVTTQIDMDELVGPVAYFVVEQDAASINRISKEFKIGFNRAQSIVENLFDLGIVSDNAGSRARDVLVSKEELDDILN